MFGNDNLLYLSPTKKESQRSLFSWASVALYSASLLIGLMDDCRSPAQAQEKDPSKPAVTSPANDSDSSSNRAANLPDDINRAFLDPEMNPEEFIKRFEIESREVYAQRTAILEALELKPGSSVADIGAGTGLFLQPLSKSTGSNGRVYAVEISPSFLKHLNARKRQEELTNVAVVSCSDRHCNLPAGSVDRLLLCDVYHHFEYPQATLSSLYDALKPGGMMVLVDFYREPENVSSERKGWLLGHIRAPLEVFRSEIEQAGFAFRDQVAVSGFKENYLLRFEKPAKNVR